VFLFLKEKAKVDIQKKEIITNTKKNIGQLIKATFPISLSLYIKKEYFSLKSYYEN
jgi:hypothetical protein